jgi:DtxR family Mn-dependent transcriptional regulator
MPSQTEENYLKALHSLANDNNEISVSELSKRLEISSPTANNMVHKLHKKGWVVYEKYKPIKLTSKGKREAGLIIRKHRLTEMFLVEMMGIGWEVVHEIAEQLEHIKSPIFFQKMDEILGFPKEDPHGSPIPDRDGNMVWKVYDKLQDCNEGQKVKLAAVLESSADFLRYLNSKNLSLGTELEVVSKEPFDGSMTVNYNAAYGVVLSDQVSANLLIERL